MKNKLFYIALLSIFSSVCFAEEAMTEPAAENSALGYCTEEAEMEGVSEEESALYIQECVDSYAENEAEEDKY